jgi:hypothetical protein
MLSYETTATIDAPPDAIWQVLTDAPGYATWDSGIQRLEGTVAPGEKLKLWAEVNPKRAFALKVTDFEPGRRMVWTGGMPLGLFRGVRTFTLTPDGGSTTFHMREEYTGPLLGLISRSMPDLGPSFEQFGKGLKARVESGA